MALLQARLGIGRLNAFRLNAALPEVPRNPNPPTDTAAGPYTLTWRGDGGASYRIEFGTTNPPPTYRTGTTPSVDLPPLTDGTVYYWRVTSESVFGTVVGPVWTFTARKPSSPTLIAPANGSIGLASPVTLTWTAVPADTTPIFYDVGLGPDAYVPPPRVATVSGTTTNYVATIREGGIDYLWRIVARNNAGASPSLTWGFQSIDRTRLVWTINGATPPMRIAGLSVRDLLTDQPNTCRFVVEVAPAAGHDVRIGLGSLDPANVIFGGLVDTITTTYEGVPSNRVYEVTCQDYTLGINRRKVRIRYGQQSATAIARDVLTRYAPAGYTGTHIVDGLPIVEGGIDFTEEDVTECFSRLSQRIGGYWYVDYQKDVHLFITEAFDAPTPITRAARVLLNDPPITHALDATQLRTRVYSEGGGAAAREPVAPGATTIPVEDGTWYASSGGLVVSGPQRIRYSGKGLQPGPAPPYAAPQQVVGNLGAGPYSYKVTTIGSGVESPQSVPSNAATIPNVADPATAITAVDAPFPPPATAPTLARRVGGSLSVGRYYWLVTFVTAYGETTNGPVNWIDLGPETTGTLTDTASIATSAARDTFMGVPTNNPPGSGLPTLYYSVTARNAAGETLPGATFSIVNAQPLPGPRGDGLGLTSASPANYQYYYAVSWVSPVGESSIYEAPSTSYGIATLSFPFNGTTALDRSVPISNIPIGPPGITGRRIYRGRANQGSNFGFVVQINDNTTTTYHDTTPDASLGAVPANAGYNMVGTRSYEIYINAHGGPGVVARRLYRVPKAGGAPRFVKEIAGDAYGGIVDDKPDSALGAAAPSSNTTGTTILYASADLSAIAIGPAGVTKRKLYRTNVNGAAWYFLATINDNTTTTYTDTKADSGLGAAGLPPANTAGGALGNGTYWWMVTFVTATGGETTWGNSIGSVPVATGGAQLSGIPTSPDARVTKRRIYRTPINGSPWTFLLETTINDNTTTTFYSAAADGALGATYPQVNTAGGGQILVTAIAIGPAGTVQRKLYRTESGGTSYKALATIDDNATTSYQDNKSDAQLGGVNIGDTVTELTGIPASGPGAILYDILRGDEVNICIQVDDAAAQAALAAKDGSDGIIEHHIRDNRLGIPQATASGRADLTLFAYPITTVEYSTHDPKTRSGKSVSIDLPDLGISGTFTIQVVEIDRIDVTPGVYPRYRVTASSVKWTFEDVLRRLQLETPGVGQ